MAALTADDTGARQRQVGMVDAAGRAASFTGPDCPSWAGGVAGPHFAAQGNVLVGEATVTALAATFQQAKGPLWHRLVEALAAGQRAGGDSRGQQSAALLVVRAGGGYGGYNDRMIDLRVDDAAQPITELARLLDMYELYFLRPAPEDLMPSMRRSHVNCRRRSRARETMRAHPPASGMPPPTPHSSATPGARTWRSACSTIQMTHGSTRRCSTIFARTSAEPADG